MAGEAVESEVEVRSGALFILDGGASFAEEANGPGGGGYRCGPARCCCGSTTSTRPPVPGLTRHGLAADWHQHCAVLGRSDYLGPVSDRRGRVHWRGQLILVNSDVTDTVLKLTGAASGETAGQGNAADEATAWAWTVGVPSTLLYGTGRFILGVGTATATGIWIGEGVEPKPTAEGDLVGTGSIEGWADKTADTTGSFAGTGYAAGELEVRPTILYAEGQADGLGDAAADPYLIQQYVEGAASGGATLTNLAAKTGTLQILRGQTLAGTGALADAELLNCEVLVEGWIQSPASGCSATATRVQGTAGLAAGSGAATGLTYQLVPAGDHQLGGTGTLTDDPTKAY